MLILNVIQLMDFIYAQQNCGAYHMIARIFLNVFLVL